MISVSCTIPVDDKTIDSFYRTISQDEFIIIIMIIVHNYSKSLEEKKMLLGEHDIFLTIFEFHLIGVCILTLLF